LRVRPRHVVALFLLVLIAWSVRWALPTGELRDFGSFIASGRAGTQGLNPYGIYPLTFHVVLPDFDVWNPNLNPPISVPVFAQFDRTDPHTAFRVWWVFSLLCYVAAVLLLARTYARRRPAMIIWALALAGVWDTLALGQIYLPLVLATAASWVLLDRGRAIAAGVLMGIVVAVKPNFGVWPLLLLLAGHWRAPAAAALTALAIGIVPLVTHGPEIYAQWIDLVLSDRGRAEFLTNASVIGLFSRAGMTGAGLMLSVIGLVGIAAWTVRTRPDPLRATAIGIVCGILASPIAWVHYTLFLVPALFASTLSAPLLIAAALMAMPVPILLEHLDAPLWQQLTIGSAYNWAALFALAGFIGTRRQSNMRPGHTSSTVVFYDGYCGLCDRLVHFLLTRDTAGRLRFAPLQGAVARRELTPAGHDPNDLDTVVVIADFAGVNPRVLTRSRAVLHALAQLGGRWRLLAGVGSVVPSFLADAIYRSVARRRYRIFGRYEVCPLPRPEWRDRFLDEPIGH
jgi:predicted DCC family thiol-disulfide oxidoreductase YuxK